MLNQHAFDKSVENAGQEEADERDSEVQRLVRKWCFLFLFLLRMIFD